MAETAWRPPESEISELEKAVLDAARRAVLPLAAIGVPAPDRDGVVEIGLADGRLVRLVVTAQPVGSGTHAGRAVVVYEVSGHGRVADAARQREAMFLVGGRAVLDRATQAFLEVEVQVAAGPH